MLHLIRLHSESNFVVGCRGRVPHDEHCWFSDECAVPLVGYRVLAQEILRPGVGWQPPCLPRRGRGIHPSIHHPAPTAAHQHHHHGPAPSESKHRRHLSHLSPFTFLPGSRNRTRTYGPVAINDIAISSPKPSAILPIGCRITKTHPRHGSASPFRLASHERCARGLLAAIKVDIRRLGARFRR